MLILWRLAEVELVALVALDGVTGGSRRLSAFSPSQLQHARPASR